MVDLKYITAIYTYVPRYKMEDGKVVFCKQADFASCEGRHDFYGVFSNATVTNYTDGFWVDLKSVMGCSYMMPSTTMYSFDHNTVYDDHFLNTYVVLREDYGSFKEYNTSYYTADYGDTDRLIGTTAKDLAKAIGSPCY